MAKEKGFIDHVMSSFPLLDFLHEMFRFLKNPDILDGFYENAPLMKSGRNWFSSVVLVAVVTSSLNFLLKNVDTIELDNIVIPLYLTLLLACQALQFGMVFWFLAMVFTSLKKPAWHPLYFMQVIQTYALMNILVVPLFWLALNRIFFTANTHLPVNNIDFILGGILGLTILALVVHLLLIPTIKYLARYYSLVTSSLIALVILSTTFYVNSHLSLGFSEVIFDKEETCKMLNKYRNAEGSPERRPEKMFTDSCLAQFR